MIIHLNAMNNDVTWNKRNYLLFAAKEAGLENVFVPYEGGQVDYVLNIEPFFNFVKGNKWTGIWEIDVMLDRQDMNISNWIASDVVFVANSNVPERMNIFQGKKFVLFQACEPSLHKRVDGVTQKYDFVFSGTIGLDIYRERERTINLLRKEGFTFQDYQKGHPPLEYIKKISEARVQFIRSGEKDSFKSQVEQRFFECLAIGPVLKDYHPDLEKLSLEEGKDFFWYKDDSEMIEKMHFLIDNPDFANEMARNGRNKALLYHTYEHRLISIMNIIKEEP